MPEASPIYHPRNPFQPPLWNILHNNYEEFKTNYDESYEKQYGFFRPVIDDVVHDYLKCGDLKEGFARVRCTNPDCRHEYLLAFSCKGRWFCPSCHSKKVIKFGEDVCNNILYPLPHRQFVFSIPVLLRIYFKYNRKLLADFCHCARESLEILFSTVLYLPDGIPGLVMVIHTFGDYARFHPHLHAIVADGLFRKSGSFYVLPRCEMKQLEEIFRSSILAMLKRKGKIANDLIGKLMNWHHSGFSVYAGNRITRDNKAAQETLSQYIMRNAFAEEKISYIEDSGQVLYRSDMTHGKNKKNFELLPAGQFIARVTQHIPEKGFQMVRYYGWYSNRAKGQRRKEGMLRPGDKPPGKEDSVNFTILDISDYEPPRAPSKTWRELIKKVWEVDPLTCPRCGSEMRIISLIQDTDVIRQILKHLGLWKQDAGSRCKKPKPGHGPVVYEEFDDGWPPYEESESTLH